MLQEALRVLELNLKSARGREHILKITKEHLKAILLLR